MNRKKTSRMLTLTKSEFFVLNHTVLCVVQEYLFEIKCTEVEAISNKFFKLSQRIDFILHYCYDIIFIK